MICSAPARQSARAAIGVRRLDDDRVRIGRRELERLAVELQQILNRRMQRLVERHLRAEQHVFRRDRMPVGKLRAPPKVERPRQRRPATTSHDFASIGTNFCVAVVVVGRGT